MAPAEGLDVQESENAGTLEELIARDVAWSETCQQFTSMLWWSFLSSRVRMRMRVNDVDDVSGKQTMAAHVPLMILQKMHADAMADGLVRTAACK